MAKILVIEETKGLAKAWVQKFKTEGFDVLTAPSGQAAVKAAYHRHPDLVVVDVAEKEGEAAVKQIRKASWARRLPALFLNSWHDPEIFMEYSEGLDDHLPYNWSLREVVEKAKHKLVLIS
jgi:response regulator RpfG family c-di-GMP phosphodiesterase